MTTETILTYTQIYDLWHEYEGIVGFALAIERAVLQSPEIQALRKDAERYRWLRDSESDDMGVVTGIEGIDYGSTSVAYTYEDGLCGEQLDKAIDAAMEK